MKTIGQFIFIFLFLSTCASDDLSKEDSIGAKSLNTQQLLDDYISAIQQNKVQTESVTQPTEYFFKYSPLSKLSAGSMQELAHLKSAVIQATKTLADANKNKTITKDQRCHDYEADIWWEVFWYMQSQPAIQMNEADVKAKEISTWAYQACSCSQQIQ